MSRSINVRFPMAGMAFSSPIYPSSFISTLTQLIFDPLPTPLTKTTSIMETIVSNSMPISVSSLPLVCTASSPMKLHFSSFTPKKTLFGLRSQTRLGFRFYPMCKAPLGLCNNTNHNHQVFFGSNGLINIQIHDDDCFCYRLQGI